MSNRKHYAREISPLYAMNSRKRLAELLFISLKEMNRLCSGDALYRTFPIKKKDKSVRIVDEPLRELKVVQKRIANLLGRIKAPDFLYCPVESRSHIDNAAQHRGSRVVHSLDVKKYFPNTKSRRVWTFFHREMRCSTDAAAVLTQLACLNEHLPTGSPLSPIMAYYAHVDIWEKVAQLARANGCVLTIYVDDMTISGERVPQKLIWAIKRVIHGGGLRYHKEKRAVARAVEVTGAVLRDGEILVANRHRDKLRKLKQIKSGLKWKDQSASLLGQLAGMQGVIDQVKAANGRH